MTTSNDKISKLKSSSTDKISAVDELLAQRSEVPESDALVQRIISLTEGKPQLTDQVVKSQSHVSVLLEQFRSLRIKPLAFGGTTMVLVLALISVQWLAPSLAPVTTLSGSISDGLPSQQIITTERDGLSDEFSWEAMWILEDELAFSQL